MWALGTHHGPAAIFKKMVSAMMGRDVTLLRGAGTRMATWFYAIIRALRLKECLEATVGSQEHLELDRNDRMTKAVMDVKNPLIWKAMFVVTGLAHGPVLVLRYILRL